MGFTLQLYAADSAPSHYMRYHAARRSKTRVHPDCMWIDIALRAVETKHSTLTAEACWRTKVTEHDADFRLVALDYEKDEGYLIIAVGMAEVLISRTSLVGVVVGAPRSAV